ncbi:MAG: hypothetical protein ABIJ12_07360 [bacterium]
MAIFIKYYLHQYKIEIFMKNIVRIKDAGFDGIFFPATKSECRSNKHSSKIEFYPVSEMIEKVREKELKAGIILQCFHSPQLWSIDSFSPPVNFDGTPYVPDSWYRPTCPNNPMSKERFKKILDEMSRIVPPDYFYLDFFRFPFFWEQEQLEVQHKVPPYCYCSHCFTSFSSLIGTPVYSVSQILEMLPEWLEWRTNSMIELLKDAKELLLNESQIIIATLPVSSAQLVFVTGQFPQGLIDKGCLISPLLYHAIKEKNISWVEEMLNQYQIDMKATDLFPGFQITDKEEFNLIKQWQDRFAGINFFNWKTFCDLN